MTSGAASRADERPGLARAKSKSSASRSDAGGRSKAVADYRAKWEANEPITSGPLMGYTFRRAMGMLGKSSTDPKGFSRPAWNPEAGDEEPAAFNCKEDSDDLKHDCLAAGYIV